MSSAPTRGAEWGLSGVVRLGLAAIWFGFGFYAKLLDGVPRHRAIVARVVGEGWAGPVAMAVGVGEVALAAWLLSGRWPKLCAAAQTLALVSMNTLELLFARELLLSAWGMVAANVVLLSAAWALAFATERGRSGAPASASRSES